MSKTRDQLEGYLKKLDIKADAVLDVGGSQRPVNARINTWNVKDYVVFDLPQPHETVLAPKITGDLNKPCSFFPLFDVVFCLEVFDYIYDPMTAARNLADATKQGGTLYVSFPFVYPVHNPMEDDTLRYTEFGAKKILELSGFKVEDIFYRTADPEVIMELYHHEGMRAARNYKHHDAVGFVMRCTKL